MDYTQSDANVVHADTGHRMHQDSEPVATMVTPLDLNSVIWSLMEILHQAGVTPAQFDADEPATYRKLLSALNLTYARTAVLAAPGGMGTFGFDKDFPYPSGSAGAALAEALLPVASQGRGKIAWGPPTSGLGGASVSVKAPRALYMAGFRTMGQWTRLRCPIFSNEDTGWSSVRLGSARLDISPPANDLGCEITPHIHQWYAVFAVANDGDDSFSYRVMPFFRAGSVAGNVVTLNFAGEDANGTMGGHSARAAYFDVVPPSVAGAPDHPGYNFTGPNNLAGCDVLIINETVNGRKNVFTDRLTHVVSNTNSQITLHDAGGLGVLDELGGWCGDWFLVAPPGFEHYCYLGTFYYEAGGAMYATPSFTGTGVISAGHYGGGEVRNISDSSSLVKGRMIVISDPNFTVTGVVPSPGVMVRTGGYISPLASSIVLAEQASFSSSATGSYAAFFAIDGSGHDVEQTFEFKEEASTVSTCSDGITIPFQFSPTFYFYTDGGMDSYRSAGKLQVRGWEEL